MIAKYLDPEHVWIAVGLFGQLLFSMRFIVQWVASEKRRESIIPITFWYFASPMRRSRISFRRWAGAAE